VKNSFRKFSWKPSDEYFFPHAVYTVGRGDECQLGSCRNLENDRNPFHSLTFENEFLSLGFGLFESTVTPQRLDLKGMKFIAGSSGWNHNFVVTGRSLISLSYRT
jgi:hypothetical protein